MSNARGLFISLGIATVIIAIFPPILFIAGGRELTIRTCIEQHGRWNNDKLACEFESER